MNSTLYQLPSSAKCQSLFIDKILDTTKDIVITLDFECYSSNNYVDEGFTICFIDSYYQTQIGGGPGSGLGYASVSGLSATVNSSLTSNWPGIIGGYIGIGFDLTGNYSLSNVGFSGYSTPIANSIAIRGPYYENYPIVFRTPTLSTYNIPFTICDSVSSSGIKRARVRITDFGQTLIIDLKSKLNNDFFNYATISLPFTLPVSVIPGLTYSTGVSGFNLKVRNININGILTQNTTPLYTLSGDIYFNNAYFAYSAYQLIPINITYLTQGIDIIDHYVSGNNLIIIK